MARVFVFTAAGIYLAAVFYWAEKGAKDYAGTEL